MTKRIAVVGCGPAGVMAGWAARLSGHDVTIFADRTVPTEQRGAIYLHKPVPVPHGPTPRPSEIMYVKKGSPEGYARKIYGQDNPPHGTSWSRFAEGRIQGWNMASFYRPIFDELFPSMVAQAVDRKVMAQICADYDLVFNTAPAHLFCEVPETAVVQTEDVLIWSERREHPGVRASGLIVYEGTPSIPWYRYSYLDGVQSFEFPVNADPATVPAGAVKVSKPLAIDQPPMHSKIVSVGRYGKWKKGELVDGVFAEVTKFLR